jgi:hypothetical protein
MAATAIKPAIKPYSMAVAPFSSTKKALTLATDMLAPKRVTFLS